VVQARNINLRFRDGVVEDAERVADLGRLTFTENFGSVFKRSDLDLYMDRYFSLEKVKKDLEDTECDYRLAEGGITLVGYAKVSPVTLPIQDDGKTRLQLHRLYVRGTRQGVGVGGILLSWAIERAKERGADELCLGVSADNLRAINVYESRGFVAFGKQTIHVGDATDEEVMMTLPLQAEAKSKLSA
tara:strand:- start:124932 stop:125495 length:564 start_codon:yes stop_codon:yes gene_type:complete